jgi:hypothetical protein
MAGHPPGEKKLLDHWGSGACQTVDLVGLERDEELFFAGYRNVVCETFDGVSALASLGHEHMALVRSGWSQQEP